MHLIMLKRAAPLNSALHCDVTADMEKYKAAVTQVGIPHWETTLNTPDITAVRLISGDLSLSEVFASIWYKPTPLVSF